MRPPEMWSSVVHILARSAGLRYVFPVASTPSRSRRVTAAAAVSKVQPSKAGPCPAFGFPGGMK